MQEKNKETVKVHNTHSFIICGCLKSFRNCISLLIFPTTSRLLIFCLFKIFTATLCPVIWCLATEMREIRIGKDLVGQSLIYRDQWYHVTSLSGWGGGRMQSNNLLTETGKAVNLLTEM